MSEQPPLYNSVAPLANVGRVTALIKRIEQRVYGLPGLGCVYGRSGRGKTTAAIYATNSLGAVHIECLPLGGIKGVLRMIAVELGLRPKRTAEELFMQVAEQLVRSGRPLIIDEADHIIKDRSIEVIRRLHDTSGVPLILMGEEALPQKLKQWERVHSRILSWVGMEEATREDLDHLARIYAPGLTLSADFKGALLTASRGSHRNISANLCHVKEEAQKRGLRSIDLADWGGQPFHTGEAPMPRYAPAPKRRGAA